MVINHNLNAMNAHRNMSSASKAQGNSMEKLSSGLRINRAGDDAAGLAISEKMRAQIRGLDQASRNAQDGISLIQTAEGAMNESQSIVQRMRELAIQSANGTYVDADRELIDSEFQSLIQEIDRIAEQTEFNGTKILNGDLQVRSYEVDAHTGNGHEGFERISGDIKQAGDYVFKVIDNKNKVELKFDGQTKNFDIKDNVVDLTADYGFKLILNEDLALNNTMTLSVKEEKPGLSLQVGANANQNINVSVNDMSSTALGINRVSFKEKTQTPLDIKTAESAQDAIDQLSVSLDRISSQRATLGAAQNRLEHTIASTDNTAENLQAAESRIRDVDMAKEMMNLTKLNILNQASQAMLSQANQNPQNILSLLR